MLLVIQFLVLLSNILLSAWYIPKGAILFANYLAYVGQAAQPIVIVRLEQHPAKWVLMQRTAAFSPSLTPITRLGATSSTALILTCGSFSLRLETYLHTHSQHSFPVCGHQRFAPFLHET